MNDPTVTFLRTCALCGEPTREGERTRLTTAHRTHISLTLEVHGRCLVELVNRHAAVRLDLKDVPLF